MFVGNSAVKSYFERIVRDGVIGHAYCLVGQDQVGKRTLANEAAAHLLGTTPEKLAAHPDYYYVSRLVDEKTGKLKKDINIAQARTAKGQLQGRSWLGGYQVFVFDEAERLNSESGNALLKSLEEPAEKSVLFILTEDDKKILPTIRSRCQIWQMSPVKKEEIEAWLIGAGTEADTASLIAEWSWGRPGRAQRLLVDQEFLRFCLTEAERWDKIKKQPVYLRWQNVEDLINDKTDSNKMRDHLSQVIDIWQWQARRQLMVDPTDKGVTMIDQLNNLKKILSTNINVRLALEHTLLNI